MYTNDTFFTLTQPGQIGLAVLSAALFVLICITMWRVAPRLPRWGGICLALVVFWLFVWLSPQIYYTYYMTQFEGLPLQSVIHPPPTPLSILQFMTFLEKPTLSAHTKAVLAWTLIAIAVWRGKR